MDQAVRSEATTQDGSVRKGLLWAAGIVILAGVVLIAFFVWEFIRFTDFSTRADARSFAVRVDETLSSEGALPLGSSQVRSEGPAAFDYQVVVTQERLPAYDLHVEVREFREDGYTVDLWSSAPIEGSGNIQALGHWSEQSGGATGPLRDLHGEIRRRVLEASPSQESGASHRTVLLEYTLEGTQNGREVRLHRKLAL